MAKLATYRAPIDRVFEQVVEATEETYKLAGVDAAGFKLVTAEQMYSSEGGRQSEGADGMVRATDRSVILTLTVEVKQVDDRLAVVITPRTLQILKSYPQPRELAPDDPGLPPWVLGRVDALSVAIYRRLKPVVASP